MSRGICRGDDSSEGKSENMLWDWDNDDIIYCAGLVDSLKWCEKEPVANCFALSR